MSRIPTDPEQIRILAQIMSAHGLNEVEMSDKDIKLRVLRGASPSATVTQTIAAAPVAEAPRPAAASAPAADTGAGHPGAVTSPMVGVAFLAPEPGAANFVSVGSRVSVGDTLLLIEAMKTFNQIKAAKAGTVTRIVVQNSTPVEYGEVLMIVE